MNDSAPEELSREDAEKDTAWDKLQSRFATLGELVEERSPILRGWNDAFLDEWRSKYGDIKCPIESLEVGEYCAARYGGKLSFAEIDASTPQEILDATIARLEQDTSQQLHRAQSDAADGRIAPRPLIIEQRQSPTESRPVRPIDARNAWMYQLAAAGDTNKEILQKLKSEYRTRDGWGLLSSEQGVSNALSRWAKSNGKDWPVRFDQSLGNHG
ncbi:hypothetical protein [Botrimarina mediterranea]|uniref:Uncharacterized protein n=1 Tax=Botrimarina mediterranea TaxID=2528022 RepID=A0A518K903_9BACT|nr:hypothetical protein [Botrimarina mediterranea]QDV74274.1 hypothetical protein Spa11_24750 [Botrimarina mediterranea]